MTDVRDGSESTIASGAKMIMLDDELLVAIPARELPNATPRYRITAFCADSSEGRTDESEWSGDLWPIVGDELATFAQ